MRKQVFCETLCLGAFHSLWLFSSCRACQNQQTKVSVSRNFMLGHLIPSSCSHRVGRVRSIENIGVLRNPIFVTFVFLFWGPKVWNCWILKPGGFKFKVQKIEVSIFLKIKCFGIAEMLKTFWKFEIKLVRKQFANTKTDGIQNNKLPQTQKKKRCTN